MKRRLLSLLAILILCAGVAYSQIALGGIGSVYSSADLSIEDLPDLFRSEGVFYGFFAEFGFSKLALGASGAYSEYFDADLGGQNMADFDIAGYLQVHPFGYKAFLDPFLEAGFGLAAKDYAEEEDDPDSSNSLLATKYYQVGGGLGLNFGHLGIFLKGLYLIPSGDPVEAKVSGGSPYNLDPYPLSPLKIVLGAKLIL
ncbi:MAG TPA: hypothetical protein VIO60_10470 [Rectinemataceae bacterium]